jgi:hypothetical protein
MAQVAAAAATPTATAFSPAGKTFLQRLDACLADAKATHGVTIRKDSGRTAEWQHKHHVAHMFLYNKYNNNKPKHPKTGGKTIDWDHFKKAVVWEPIIWSEFLRTEKGTVPVKDGTDAGTDQWKAGEEPDEAKTQENVKQILKDGGIGKNGEAMVSAGFAPCKEPCACNAGRSKHLTDSAADLNKTDLASLKTALDKAKTTIDAYLKTFGLHRPLLNHAESPEDWHVESTDDTTEES